MGFLNRDRFLTVHGSAQGQMWAARTWIVPRCNVCHMCEANALHSVRHCECTWEPWERKLVSEVEEASEMIRGNAFTSLMGKRRQNKNQTSYQPLRGDLPEFSVFYWLALTQQNTTDRLGILGLGILRNSLRDLEYITWFLWVSVLLSVKWKSRPTDRTVVTTSSVHRGILLMSLIILITAEETGMVVLFLQILFPDFIMVLFRSLLLRVWSEDQELQHHLGACLKCRL